MGATGIEAGEVSILLSDGQRNSTYFGFRDLQIPDLNTTCGEVGDFKFDINRPFGLALAGAPHTAAKPTGHTAAVFVVALDGRQAELRAHEELLPTAELLDLPDDGRFLGCVMNSTDIGSETR